MNKELIEMIHEFNSNLIKEDNSKRIILCTLKPVINHTIVWKDGTKTFQNENGTVTTAPNSIK